MSTLLLTADEKFHILEFSTMENADMKWKPIDTTDAKVRHRFNGYVAKRGKDECWEWTGPKANSGHGQLWDGKRNVAAHRYAKAITGADIEAAVVCHRCNNPGCVNPRHLYAGSHQTNIDDAKASGIKFGNPAPSGEDNYMAVLTAEQVKEIIRRYVPRDRANGTRALAREFGASQQTISKIVRGVTWRHLR